MSEATAGEHCLVLVGEDLEVDLTFTHEVSSIEPYWSCDGALGHSAVPEYVQGARGTLASAALRNADLVRA